MGAVAVVLLSAVLHGPPPAASLPRLLPPLPSAAVVMDDSNRILRRASQRYLLPTLEIGALNAPSLVWALTFSVAEETRLIRYFPFEAERERFWRFWNWTQPSFPIWRQNITSPPKFPDADEFFVNYIVHPLVGLQIHQMYRNHGASFLESITWVVLWALFWEFIAEAGYEHPSANDVLANFAGGLAGEAAFRARQLITAQLRPGFPRNALLAILDPAGTLETIVLDLVEETPGGASVVRWVR